MSANWARVFGGILAVAVIWIAAYWWLNAPRNKISFGTREPSPISLPASSRPAKPAAPTSKPPPVFVDEPPPTLGSPLPASTTAEPEDSPKPDPVSPAPAAPATKPAPAAIIPPRFTDYTIQRHDTLGSIALARLGSTRHIEAIRRSNPFKDLDRLKIGDVIRLPADPANIQGKPVEGAPAPAPPAERQGEMLEYTVQNGDTLSKIARDKYGSTTYQDLIYNANRDRLKTRAALKEGQKLRLPKKP